MTILNKEATGGVEGRNIFEYLAVALVAVVIGVSVALGFQAITDADEFGPAQIEQARYTALAEQLENQWIAEVNTARADELIEFYRAPFMARVARIQEQRAADMVEHYSNIHRGKLARINEQRAEDMVRFQYGANR